MLDDVRSPRLGYDNPEKQKYRECVWEHLLTGWDVAKHDSRSHVMIMPSKEGCEIEYILKLGIPEDRIIAIDKSAAVIATSKWRKRFPSVKFFAVSVGEAAKKIRAKGYVLAAANLDYCTNFSLDFVDQTKSFINSAPKFSSFRFAVTVAKGREGAALTLMLKRFAKGHSDKFKEPRLSAMFALTDITGYGLCKEGMYTSGRNPMAWGVFKLLKCEIDEMKNAHVSELKSSLAEVASACVSSYGKNGRGFGKMEDKMKEEFSRLAGKFADDFELWRKASNPIDPISPSDVVSSGWDLNKGRKRLVTEDVFDDAIRDLYKKIDCMS